MDNSSLELQISDLEKQISDKKASIEKTSASAEGLPPDKEILHEVVGEKIQEHAPEWTPKFKSSTQNASATDDTPSYGMPDLKDKVQELINIAFTKNIAEAVKLAGGNPALLDAFHDVLVDELYDVLVERKKIEIVNN